MSRLMELIGVIIMWNIKKTSRYQCLKYDLPEIPAMISKIPVEISLNRANFWHSWTDGQPRRRSKIANHLIILDVRVTSLEFSAGICQRHPLAFCVPQDTEDDSYSVTPLATDMSHCGLLAALTIILYGAPVTFLCDSVTLISACSSSIVSYRIRSVVL